MYLSEHGKHKQIRIIWVSKERDFFNDASLYNLIVAPVEGLSNHIAYNPVRTG